MVAFQLVHSDLDDLRPEQREHAIRVAKEFSVAMAAKYAKGQREHGGNLFDMGPLKLLDNSIEEAIDLVVYLHTLREQLSKLLGGE